MRILTVLLLTTFSTVGISAPHVVGVGESLQEAIDTAEKGDTIRIDSNDYLVENLLINQDVTLEAGDGFVPVLTSKNSSAVIGTTGTGFSEIEIVVRGVFFEAGEATSLFELVDNSKITLEDSYLKALQAVGDEDVVSAEIESGALVSTGTIYRTHEAGHVLNLDMLDSGDKDRIEIAEIATRLERLISERDKDDRTKSMLDPVTRYLRAAVTDRNFGESDRQFKVFDYLAFAAYRLGIVTYNTSLSEGLTEDLDSMTQDIGRIAREMSQDAVNASESELAKKRFQSAEAQLANDWHYEALREFGQAWEIARK